VQTPTWFPEKYQLNDIVIEKTPLQETVLAIYTFDNHALKISVKSFLDIEPEKIEQSTELIETYIVDDVEYYIFSNHQQTRAAWLIDTYECYISGDLSIRELKAMIDSIEKGN